MTLLARLVLAGTILSLAACGSTPDKRLLQNLNTQEEWAAIGDSITLTDPCHPDEIDVVVTVDADGRVLLPEIGSVDVAGRTVREIEASLRQRFAPVHDTLSVDLTTSSDRYFVFGEVRRVGLQPFSGVVGVTDAVLLARPRIESADLNHVRLIRANARGTEPLVLDLSKGLVEGSTSCRALVRKGDIIYVPSTHQEDVQQAPPVLLASRGE
ncbi:MAG TPA: polysaccharide biosynthesis/export family protein [Planctomycetota bacterium]|jgi:protein involved in polysaccharide export with SLBB domain|nr:polysaccharide biosynthesis/export family protein [Planctomycetota bacterium]